MIKLINYFFILAIAGYIVLLHATGQLNLYISTRYTVFTYIFALIALVAAVVGLIRSVELKVWREKINADWEQWGGIALMLLVVLLGYLLPVSRFDVNRAAQLESDFNAISVTAQPSTADLFIGNTENYSLGDWVNSLAYDPDPNKYLGKEVNISGFAFISDRIPPETFRLSRFVITCCAVDARPVGLVIKHSQESMDVIEQGDWYKINGEFVKFEDMLVVQLNSVEEIAEPDNPYIF